MKKKTEKIKGENFMASKTFKNVYQFKITLQDISPVIWRRIQVPENYTFWDLHVAIQDSMGWTDSHLHAFRLKNPETDEVEEIGIPEDSDFAEFPMLAGWEEDIADWFSEENNSANYNYDFGDDWNHDLVLERILPKEANTKYPVCLAGERACPPEDCGSVPGYERLCEIIKNPDAEEYDEMMEWLGGKYDPDEFDCKQVVFDNPKKRLKNVLASY
ncbi:MAG: plasmid pRiA4b ORF-3 family protein [Spirochaetales bacterium]|nr:plasmid pRiA4b ORF-3 family protein [Spirochaetales bacterium]